MSSSAICDGPSSPIDTPACEPQSENVARLIAAMRTKSYARERKAANVDANGRQPDGLEADSGRDQLLLGDVHLEVALGVRLREGLGERRVRDLAVEGDDVGPRRAERSERVAVRLPRRDLGAELVPGKLELRRRRSRRGLDSGFATSIRTSRSPPSSAIAASGSSSGLPWKPFWFSTAATPFPFIVRATTTVGFPAVATA